MSNAAKARWADAKQAAGLCIDCGKVPARVDRLRCWCCGEKDSRRRAWRRCPVREARQ